MIIAALGLLVPGTRVSTSAVEAARNPARRSATRAARTTRARRVGAHRAFAVLACGLLLGVGLLPVATAGHPQTTEVGTARFTQVGGNEWWVQVRILGPTASSVEARDTGGPWVRLQAQTWTSDRTWWAASFRIETGHQVMFRASFPDAEPCLLYTSDAADE